MSFQLAKLTDAAHDTGFSFLQRAIRRSAPTRQRSRIRSENDDPNAVAQQISALQQRLQQLTATKHTDKRSAEVAKVIGLHQVVTDAKTAEIGKALTQGMFGMADRALMRVIKSGDTFDVHIDIMELVKLLVLIYAGVKLLDFATT